MIADTFSSIACSSSLATSDSPLGTRHFPLVFGHPQSLLERFLTQPVATTGQFTGIEGKPVALEDTINGCERILMGEYDDAEEKALYMIGAIEEAKQREKTT